MNPRILLRIEGAAVLLAACVLYGYLQGSWLWFALLLLTPDISMLGYLLGKRPGAMCYNAIHTYTGPIALGGLLWLLHISFSPLLLIWVAHIGLDRMLGYGLKYESDFRDTHLQRV